VETSDATRLLLWENNPLHWKVTDTEVPFSMTAIMQLIEQQQNFRSTGQLRLMICLTSTQEAVGTVDLYDADFLHNLSCSIQEDNDESVRLFKSVGFEKVGVRKEWFLLKGQRMDEIIFQLCLKK